VGSSTQNAEPRDAANAASPQARAELTQTVSDASERLGFIVRPDAAAENDTVLETRIEIARLKEMLSGQEQATLRALGSARDLQNQLKDALGEVARLNTQLKVALAAADTARISPPDSQFAQSQLLRMQKDLQRERAGRQSEAEQGTEKISKLEVALADAVDQLGRSKTAPPLVKTWTGVAAAAILAGILAGSGMFWYLRHSGPPAEAEQQDAVADSSPVPSQEGSSMPVRRSSAWSPSKESAASKAQPEFTRSLDRLTRALGAFPGQDPQAVLLQVSLKRSTSQKRVCSFDWKDGQPALVFDKGKLGGNSLSSAITECAEAVEQFR
jgi:hypothetical protein